jgi:hypothetical protein
MSQCPFTLTLQIPLFARCPKCALAFDDVAENKDAD